MSSQLALDFPAEYFRPEPLKPLSSQARRLCYYLQAFPSARDKGIVFATHEYLACKLNRCIRTIIRWLQELVAHGYLERRRRGPRSNEYRFLKTLEKSTDRGKPVDDVISHVTSSSDSTLLSEGTNSPSERPDADALEIAEEKVGQMELAGKKADPSLKSRLAKLLPTRAHWDRLSVGLREFCRRDRIRGWGIIVRLAEQTALSKIEPQPPKEPEFVNYVLPGKEAELAEYLAKRAAGVPGYERWK